MTKQPNTLSALKSSLLAEFEKVFSYEYFIGEHDGRHAGIMASDIWFFTSRTLDTVAEKTAEVICRLIDDIEIQDESTTIEQWKQYKYIRNAIRDQWLGVDKILEKIGGKND